ncbi:UDP-galactose/UDP-glucose transporter 5B [Gossypium australe]|uniref:UDP-galactose/UDP-glucose transporter 5B n=1 Tax=Gossypium australe TaxID=47621 RepID=A0A5B6VRU7_9ROSI|nr:UDP-galactose/UDP-glucose transporter 5B [Gossypium australe]
MRRSSVSNSGTASQFFISYTIRTFGALTFAAKLTRDKYHPKFILSFLVMLYFLTEGDSSTLLFKLVSVMLSCVWFGHPLSWEQWIEAVIVLGSLYTKNLKNTSLKPPPPQQTQNGASCTVKKIAGPISHQLPHLILFVIRVCQWFKRNPAAASNMKESKFLGEEELFLKAMDR